ncbi:hypothetical protein G6F43_012445 [Rhizopus delemar]|nr:hypothetical protein G6F43_012445 [Rhizopus delemar]
MLHGELTNQNTLSPSTEGIHIAKSQPTSGQDSATLWQTFTAYSKAIRGSSVKTFEDPAAKTASRERRQARIWIRSTEKNSVAFEMPKAVLPATFLKALAAQFPTAIGVVPVKQGDHHGVIVAFDTVEAQTQACSIGVQVGNLTIIGTQTLSSDNPIYRISLDRLPILRPEELTPLVRQMLEPYGKVLHVGLLLDPATNLFFGKGFAFLDTSSTEDSTYRQLSHEMHLDNHRLVFASWRGMETHCFYCHKPGHTKATCPILESRKLKTCYGCQSPQHLFKDCPEQRNNRIGSKRPRTDPVAHRGATSAQAGHNNATQQSKTVTSTIDNIASLENKELPDETAVSEKPQDHVKNLPIQAKIQDTHYVDNTTDVPVSVTATTKTHSINANQSTSIHENNSNIMKHANDLAMKDQVASEEDNDSDSDYQPPADDQSEDTESDTEEHGSEDEMDLDEEVRILQEEARVAHNSPNPSSDQL